MILEREPRPKLNLSRWCRGFGYGSELRRIHEAIRRSQIRVVESVESLDANLATPPAFTFGNVGRNSSPELTKVRTVEK